MHITLSRSVSATLLAGVVSSAAFLVGCESALTKDPDDHGYGQYSASLVARAVTDPKFMNQAVANPTVNKGVHEFARVDSAGPTTGGGATTESAIVPADSNAQAFDMTAGLKNSQLNASEAPINLALQDAIARAMRNNLDIKVEAYNPAIKEAQIIEAQAIFDPVLFGNHQWTNTDSMNTGPAAGALRGTLATNQFGVRDLLPTGGTITGAAGINYYDINPPIGSFSTASSGWNPNLTINLAQPLLRGFGSNVNNANIYLAQRDRRISLATFRRKVISTVGDIEEAYQNLVLATTSIAVQERLLRETEATRKKVKEREKIDADQVSVSQAIAAVEQRRADLIRARSQLRSTSDRLKALINDPELDLRGNGLLVPTDRPTTEPMVYNVAEEIDIALRQRTELQEARLQVERADIVVDVARNDLLPKADVTLGITGNGTPDNSLEQAFSTTFNSNKFIDYAAGFKWEIPFGNREAGARYYRRKLERRQALTNLVSQAQKVVLDVKLQLREVLTTYEEIGARESARAAAGRELRALTDQEEIVKLSPEFLRLKLDAQQRLANAELTEIQSMVTYNVAIARLEQAKGTLLEYNRIAVNVEPPPQDPRRSWLNGESITNPLSWFNMKK